MEEQAIDRAHRIGQTKPVHVTRITIEGGWGIQGGRGIEDGLAGEGAGLRGGYI